MLDLDVSLGAAYALFLALHGMGVKRKLFAIFVRRMHALV
jgi:hypothetical protein